MKTRLSKVLNFLAFNVLFFALYLNFLHKGSTALPASQPIQTNTSIKATVSVKHTEQYLQKAVLKHEAVRQLNEKNDNAEALKLHFN